MATCQGIVRYALRVGEDGFPITEVIHCRRTVGVSTWTGSLGQTRRACSRHFGQVAAADRPAFREPQTPAEWMGIRPEMARGMR